MIIYIQAFDWMARGHESKIQVHFVIGFDGDVHVCFMIDGWRGWTHTKKDKQTTCLRVDVSTKTETHGTGLSYPNHKHSSTDPCLHQ